MADLCCSANESRLTAQLSDNPPGGLLAGTAALQARSLFTFYIHFHAAVMQAEALKKCPLFSFSSSVSSNEQCSR